MRAALQRTATVLLLGVVLSGCTAQKPRTSLASAYSGSEEMRLVQLATDIQRRGDKRSALPLLERAVSVSGNRPAANIRLGYARLEADQPETAQSAFRAALDKETQNASALLGLGTAQLKAGQIDAAIRSLGDAATKVGSPQAFNRYGTALMLKGDGANADAAFAQARRLEPANLDTQTNLALAKALSGSAEEGVAIMREVVASPRAEARHFRNQLLILVLAGREKDASSTPVPDYPNAERQQFLVEARKVAAVKDAAGRARAIGLLAS